MEGQDGLLKCSIHNFSTNSPDEYFQHEREFEHERNETHLCGSCGSEVTGEGPRTTRTFTAKLVPDKVHHPRHNCPTCQERVDKEILERLVAEGKIKKEQIV